MTPQRSKIAHGATCHQISTTSTTNIVSSILLPCYVILKWSQTTIPTIKHMAAKMGKHGVPHEGSLPHHSMLLFVVFFLTFVFDLSFSSHVHHVYPHSHTNRIFANLDVLQWHTGANYAEKITNTRQEEEICWSQGGGSPRPALYLPLARHTLSAPCLLLPLIVRHVAIFNIMYAVSLIIKLTAVAQTILFYLTVTEKLVAKINGAKKAAGPTACTTTVGHGHRRNATITAPSLMEALFKKTP